MARQKSDAKVETPGRPPIRPEYVGRRRDVVTFRLPALQSQLLPCFNPTGYRPEIFSAFWSDQRCFLAPEGKLPRDGARTCHDLGADGGARARYQVPRALYCRKSRQTPVVGARAICRRDCKRRTDAADFAHDTPVSTWRPKSQTWPRRRFVSQFSITGN